MIINVGSFLARSFLGLIAVSSVTWAASLLATGNSAARLNEISNRIMAGDDFRLNPINDLPKLLEAAEARSYCNPLEIRGAAIIRVRQYEDAVNVADIRLANQQMLAAGASIDRALACVPTEGFLWFVRYWSGVLKSRPTASRLNDLRMSYVLSPFEGWIALRRSPFALAVYETLPDDMKNMVVNEFVAIAASGFTAQTIKNLSGPGWPIRDKLLPKLADVRIDIRQAISNRMQAEGLPVTIPGVEPREFRPWQ